MPNGMKMFSTSISQRSMRSSSPMANEPTCASERYRSRMSSQLVTLIFQLGIPRPQPIGSVS